MEDEIPVRPIDEEDGRDQDGDEGREGSFESGHAKEFVDEEKLESGIREPRRLQDPKLPSQEEIRAHEMTHLPYRSWCVHCVRGKGKSLDHRRCAGGESQREVHLDYCLRGAGTTRRRSAS